MAKKSKRPCEAPGVEPYRCYWQISGLCIAYNPSVSEDSEGTRIPKYAHSYEVPVDFCESHQIIKNDIDANFNRNIHAIRYERGQAKKQKKITKKSEREAMGSGSEKTRSAIDGEPQSEENPGLF